MIEKSLIQFLIGQVGKTIRVTVEGPHQVYLQHIGILIQQVYGKPQIALTEKVVLKP